MVESYNIPNTTWFTSGHIISVYLVGTNTSKQLGDLLRNPDLNDSGDRSSREPRIPCAVDGAHLRTPEMPVL